MTREEGMSFGSQSLGQQIELPVIPLRHVPKGFPVIP